MKFSRSTLMISLVLNLVLLAAAGILFSKPAPKAGERVVTKVVTNNETATEIVTSLPEQILETKTNTPFDWNMVASADLEAYVKNLRAIGCPQDTIRDIITPEVDEIFVKKLTEKLDPLRQGFWTILANWKTQEKEVEERMNGVEKFSDERKEMLRKLLGAEKDSTAQLNPSERNQELLGFLPKEKQEQMRALTKKYNEERRRLRKEANGPTTPEERKAVDELGKKTDAERKALMTPEEFEEYQLRGGNYTRFRYNVAMPDFSGEEVRALAKIHMDIDQSQPPEPGRSTDPDYEKIQKARKDALNEALKAHLGEERYAEYKRAEDGNFKQVYSVTERYDLPRETAVKVFELQQSATKQANELRKAKDISDDERAELLSVLQQETQRSVTQTLGADAAKTYQRYGGGWLDGLGDE